MTQPATAADLPDTLDMATLAPIVRARLTVSVNGVAAGAWDRATRGPSGAVRVVLPPVLAYDALVWAQHFATSPDALAYDAEQEGRHAVTVTGAVAFALAPLESADVPAPAVSMAREPLDGTPATP